MTNCRQPSYACMPECAAIAAWFEAFCASFLAPDTRGPLVLKIQHTGRVVAHARQIRASLALEPVLARSALLAALLHDVGRFPQFKEWHTFRDPDSINHGHLGAKTLLLNNVLHGEAPQVRRLVLTGVALHNRLTLPSGLDEAAHTVTSVVRDADKIDILHIFSEELMKDEPSPDVLLHVTREQGKWSQPIVEKVLAGVVPQYSDLCYVNDFIMLLGTWVPSLVFPESKRIVQQSGCVEILMGVLPQDAALDPVREKILSFIG